MPTLLAVDLGLKTGFALYDQTGRLCWYRSRKIGSKSKLRKTAYDVLTSVPDVAVLVLEGGGDMAGIWQHEAGKQNIQVIVITAETWRRKLLYRREQRSGKTAKNTAETLARAVIEWSGAARPTSLRTDAAEAILVGLWGVLQAGWLERIPDAVRL